MAHSLNRIFGRYFFNFSLGLAPLALACAGWSMLQIYQLHDYNQHLAHHKLSHLHNNHALLLNAYIYANKGQTQKALASYAQLSTQAQPYAKAAYFNSGNLYLQQATELLQAETLMAWDEAGPLLALAKNSYQHALTLQSDWSEAKYNFELALRLSPANHGRKGPQEYEREEDKAEEKPSGWPSIPGTPRGMP